MAQGIINSLPSGSIKKSTLDGLKEHEKVDAVIDIFSHNLHGEEEVLSFVIGISGKYHGLHCDHDTAEWKEIVVEDDLDTALMKHEAWLDDDMDRVMQEQQ